MADMRSAPPQTAAAAATAGQDGASLAVGVVARTPSKFGSGSGVDGRVLDSGEGASSQRRHRGKKGATGGNLQEHDEE